MPTNQQWWESLSPQWQQAFTISVLQKEGTATDEDIEGLKNSVVLRLAGPEAPHPNCTFKLTDLSGIVGLDQLQILIVTHHDIQDMEEVSKLPQLKSIFINNNCLKNLKGIEDLHNLEQLYVQCNELSSIAEIEKLTQLRELYISDNKIASLAGLTEQHAEHLTRFVCMPNELLKQKEIIHTEREIGIICR